MEINLKIFYVQVPLNAAGLEELEYCDEQLQNVRTFEFSVAEQNTLHPLYYEYNSVFELMIDDYEDEMLPAEKMQEALAMAREYASKQTAPEAIAASTRLVEALELAQSQNMPVVFDF